MTAQVSDECRGSTSAGNPPKRILLFCTREIARKKPERAHNKENVISQEPESLHSIFISLDHLL
jgi:hypothetical protein